MKLVPLILLLALNVLVSYGQTYTNIHLAWDASPFPGITNYQVYASTNGIPSTNYVAQVDASTNLTCSVQDLMPGRYYFACVAMRDGESSDFSNIVIAELSQELIWSVKMVISATTLRVGTIRKR